MTFSSSNLTTSGWNLPLPGLNVTINTGELQLDDLSSNMTFSSWNLPILTARLQLDNDWFELDTIKFVPGIVRFKTSKRETEIFKLKHDNVRFKLNTARFILNYKFRRVAT